MKLSQSLRRNIFALLVLANLGCDNSQPDASGMPVRPSAVAETRINVDSTKLGVPVKPGGIIHIEGEAVLGGQLGRVDDVELAVLQGRVVHDSRFADLQRPAESELTFSGDLKAPKKPGKYTVRVTLVTDTKPVKGEAPPSLQKRLDIEVR